jgi:hypothetical protein
MDEAVLASLARWPNVPSVHGWLSLDRRGNWRLRGEPVRHAGLAAFIARNYASTATGDWYFQNGPQRVYVALDYAPWVLSWHATAELSCHTGIPAHSPSRAWLDDQGNVLVEFAGGIGLICDQDLQAILPRFSGTGAEDAAQAIEQFLADPLHRPLWLDLGQGAVPVGFIQARDVPTRFAFNPGPAPA